MKKEIKDTIEFVASILLLFIGMGLCIWSMKIPPEGEIHASVLTLIGETFTFVGAIWGIAKSAQVKIAEIAAETAKQKEKI